MQVLMTNPEVDAFTRYLLCWSKELKREFETRAQFYHLDGKKVNRKKFEGLLKNKNVGVVLVNGHGSDNCVYGNDDIILDDKNVNLIKGKVVHAMSCSSAKTLGKKAIEVGVKAYVGYDEPFLAPRMNDKISNPLLDETASLFLDPAFITQKALINNKKPKEAVSLARKEYNRSIVKALMSPIQSDNDQFVGLLFWDRDHLVNLEG